MTIEERMKKNRFDYFSFSLLRYSPNKPGGTKDIRQRVTGTSVRQHLTTRLLLIRLNVYLFRFIGEEKREEDELIEVASIQRAKEIKVFSRPPANFFKSSITSLSF